MKPDCAVHINGIDITGKIRDRILSITVNDAAGIKADTVQIELDDRDNQIAEPPDGALIAVSLGYKGMPLIPMGIFVLDAIDYSLAPDRITIRGKSAEFGGSLKEQKTRNWDNKTIGEIVDTIAGERGLTGKTSDAHRDFLYEYLAQKAESDLSFLTRIGKTHDALVAVKEGTLVFMGRGEGKSAGGFALPQTWVFKNQLMPGTSVRKNKATTYKSARAFWHNKKTGQKEAVTIGDGTPMFEITKALASKAEAERAAKAKLDEEARKSHGITLQLIGNPMYRAEGQVKVIGLRLSVPIIWSIKSVAHRFGSGGYTSQIEGELPKADSGAQ